MAYLHMHTVGFADVSFWVVVVVVNDGQSQICVFESNTKPVEHCMRVPG